MRRSLLAISIFSLLSASSLFASSESDLLSKATDGAITTAKAEGVKVLSSDEMGDVKGGANIQVAIKTTNIASNNIQVNPSQVKTTSALNTSGIRMGAGASFSINGKTYTSFTTAMGGYIDSRTGVWYRR